MLEPTGACCQEAVRTLSHGPAGDAVPAKSTGQVEQVRSDAALELVGCIGPDIFVPDLCFLWSEGGRVGRERGRRFY